MYNIIFYEDRKGSSNIKEFIHELNLKSKKDKNSSILFNKIVAYFDILIKQALRNLRDYKERSG